MAGTDYDKLFDKWKVEKFAEKEFLTKLMDLVKDLNTKVDAKNEISRSMSRFIKAHI